MEENAVERLKAKSPEEAIIGQIGRDFNLVKCLEEQVDVSGPREGR